MYKDEPYGLYKYGYIEDLEKITNEDLYKTYNELINNAKIDIFVSGNIDEEVVKELISKKIDKLNARNYKIKKSSNNVEQTKDKTIIERTNVAQGNLNIGMKFNSKSQKDNINAAVYNAVLGGGANSKLFQNVREKASLAYSAGSMYIKTKDAMIIKCGIDPENYEKTLDIVKKQLEDMEDGKFTLEDIEKAVELIVASYKSMQDEQDSEITYYFTKELNQDNMSVNDYIENIKKVSKEDIIDIAKKIKISIIYFLTKEENANE